MTENKSHDDKKPTFWTTLPGMLTGCAAMLTALVGLVVALFNMGIIGPSAPPAATAPPITTHAPTLSGSLNENTSPLLIGTRLGLPADTFQGDIDDVRLYNRALSQAEIAALFAAGP